jgi:vacuolar iron transporter family protein
MDHFEGKTVVEHLKAARAKGVLAAAEIHGAETPGFFSAMADSARDVAATLLLVWILFPLDLKWLALLMSGLLLWKAGRSAMLGWTRLTRLHRLIEEERWEIQHHRQQEKEELAALYRAKGFSGKLLEEVVETLMADDNRLLQVMLEEEMGLALEIYEHPLKQSFGAAVGVIFSSLLFLGGYFFVFGPVIASALAVAIAAWSIAHTEKNPRLQAVIWNLATLALAAGAVHLFK